MMIMESRHLFSADGHWVAFLVGEDLFWRDGQRLGWFQPSGGRPGAGWSGGIVTSRDGGQIGLITEHGVIELSAALSVVAES
jgi:hypothetical protein